MNKKIFSVILAAALTAGVMSGCSGDDDESALPSAESITADTEAATASTAAKTTAASAEETSAHTEAKTTDDADSADSTDSADKEELTKRAEEQIAVLENYYISTVSPLTRLEEYENTEGMEKECLGIYDFRGDGSCEMLVRFEWGSEWQYGYIINGYTVNSGGTVSEELLCDAHEIGSMQGAIFAELNIFYNTADGMYYKRKREGGRTYGTVRYTRECDGAEFSHSYYFDGIMLYSINDIYDNLSEESYNSAIEGITGTMTEPVPTRSDDGINIYLPDYGSTVLADLDPSKYPLRVAAPTDVSYSLNGSEATLSWRGRSGLYYIYSVKNGSYVRIGEASGDSYTFPAADYSAVCVTAVPENKNMLESEYSGIVNIDYKDYSGYSALDFIGVSGAGLMDYAGDFEQHGWNPELGDVYTSPTFPDYTFYELEWGDVRDVTVNQGGMVTDGVRYDKNILENIRDHLGISSGTLNIAWSEGGGGMHGLYLDIPVGEGIIIRLFYKAPKEDYESEYLYDYDEYCEKMELKYPGNEVNLNDVKNYVNGECLDCTVRRVTW